jgi:hypothetical protein
MGGIRNGVAVLIPFDVHNLFERVLDRDEFFAVLYHLVNVFIGHRQFVDQLFCGILSGFAKSTTLRIYLERFLR